MFKREFLNICFQVNAPNGENQKDFNVALRNKIIKQGKFLVNFSWEEDQPFFRLIVANPSSKLADYKALLNELVAISH